jgi:RNA polymerase sigma factor (sigma-70 family)
MSFVNQEQEFNTLIAQNKGILYKVVRSYCKDETDRQDLLQEIMIHLWQSLPKYNNRFKISTWVYRISIKCQQTERNNSFK